MRSFDEIAVRIARIALVFSVLLTCAAAARAQWPNGYTYSGTITVSHTQVHNTDQVNFPVLVSGTFPDLATTGNGGKVTNANGFDIIFTSDIYGLSPLNFERQSYSPTTGQAAFWVQLPLLSHTTDTVFYIFYGKAGIQTDQSNPTATWDSHYQGVWHLEGNPGGTAPQELDSTSNTNNLSALNPSAGAQGSWTSGNLVPAEIANGISSNTFNLGFTETSASLTPGTNLTVSAWINTAINNGIPVIMSQYDFSGGSAGYYLIVQADNGFLRFKISAGNNGGTPQTTFDASSGLITDGKWHYVAATYSSGSIPVLYVDGSVVPAVDENPYNLTATGGVFQGSLSNNTPFELIPYAATSFYYQGIVDEPHVSNIARSGDWIATEYNNQSNPSGFYSAAMTQTYNNSGPPTITPSPSALTFTGMQGTANPTPQSVNLVITNRATWTATAVQPWITLSTSSSGPWASSLQGTVSSTIWVQVATNGSGLTTGTNNGLVTLTPSGGSAQPLNVSFSLSPQPAPGTPYPNNYLFSGTITVAHGQVPNADQTNFPVSVSGLIPQLATQSNGGRVINSNGYDIIFTSDPNGLSPLNFERESYSPNGQVSFWVQIPDLSHTTDTVFYIFYGNASVNTDQSNKAAVWDSNYVGVWHMADSASTPAVGDSSSYSNNGTASANTNTKSAIGKIGPALNFNGSSDAVTTMLSSGKIFTWEAWVNSGAISGSNYQSLLAMDGAPYMLMDVQGGAGSFWASDSFNGSNLGVAGLLNNTWYHIVLVRSGDNLPTGYTSYLNGAEKSQVASGSWTSSATVAFGSRLGASQQDFSGILDEIRVSNIARSANWIAAEYNNQNNPSSFYSTVMDQTYGNAGPAPVITVTPSTTMTFSAVQGGANPPSQSVTVSVSNGGTWTAVPNKTWITVTPTTTSFSVQVNSAGLPVGIPNTGSVTISSANAVSQTLNVSFTISAPAITLTPSASMAFNAVQGSANPPSQSATVSVSNGAGWTATPNNSWISVTTTATSVSVQVATNGSGLVTGLNSGTVTIASPNAVSQTLNISFTITAAPGPNGYAYFATITIPPSQVPNADEANFPVLVSGTYSDLATIANGGKVTNANGYDIIFTSDAAGQVPLKFERESYSSTGQVAFWVKIPNLSHTANTVFYVFYGNAVVTTDQSNKTGVWDSNYVGVWHMADNAASTVVGDSTANNNNGVATTNTNTKSTAGEVSRALSFNGISDGVTTSASNGKTFTWEAWINSGSITSGNFQSILTIPGSSYLLMDVEGGAGSFWSSDSLGGNTLSIVGLANSTWYHLVFVRSGDNSATGYAAYLNGVLRGQAGSGTWSGAANIAAGTRAGTGQDFSGSLDEIRVSNIARSANWIATEYNNENNPSSFYTAVWGQATGGGPTLVTVPNVVGGTQAAATTTITSAGLAVGTVTQQSSSTVASGSVISESPVSGTSVAVGSSVNLVVSSGLALVTVPNVVGGTQVAATTAITGAGLAVGTVTQQSSSTVASGSVISESPSSGNSVAAGSSVNLVVSSGLAMVTVPNVVGSTQAAATTAITGAGLAVGTVTQQSSSTVASGSVISESPSSGNSVAAGSSVNLVVSSGLAMVTVPNVVGSTQAAATTAVTGAGLAVGTVTQQSSSTVASGSVISESPSSGTSVAVGSSVNLVVSSGSGSGPSSYGYYGTITIPASQVPNVDETNFPVLVSGTYSDLATVANGGKVTSASGYDIIFTSDAAGQVPLKFERESYSATGQVTFWVQIPNLSHTASTVFYVFYGNGGITTDQSNKTGVWDSNYVGVWHMGDNAASTVVSDSTGNGNNGTAAANTNTKTTTGEIGAALRFNGTTDGVTTNVASGKAFTWEAWINSGSITGGSYQSVLTVAGSSYILMDVQGGAGSFWSSDTLSGNNLSITGLASSTWYHMVFVRSGDNSATGYAAYVNGVLKGQVGSGSWSSSGTIAAGTRVGSGQDFSGSMDEIRVSNVARSGNWIATEYNNESNPSAFYSAVFGQANSGGGSLTSQTITFGPLSNQALSTGSFTVSASASSGLTVSFNSQTSSVCSVSGTTVTLLTAAPCTIQATQAGNSTYAAAAPVSQTLTVTSSSGGPTWPNGYAYQGAITVSYLPNSDQTNFPVLVSGTYPSLATIANGGQVTNSNGYDIVFTSDAAGQVPLKFERASYSPTGQVAFWVQVPVLSHTSNTVFYVFYGNASIGTDQSTKTATWDSNYAGVWHMADNAASTVVSDSTANANNGTAAANTNTKAVAGIVTGGLSFNGSSDKVTTNVVSGKTFTWEAWVSSPTISSSGYQSILTLDGSSYMLMDAQGGGDSLWSPDGLGGVPLGATGLVNNTWYQLVLVRSGDSSASGYTAYVNGVQKGQASSGVWSSTANLVFGSRLDNGSQSFTGTLDEIRVSTTVRSADWIAAEYHNESNPSTFYSAVFGLTNSGGSSLTSQSITFMPLPNQAPSTGSFTVSASASSGLTVSFNSQTSSVCSVSGTTVTLLMAGPCTVQATQAGNSTYAAAPPVNQTFTVTASSSGLLLYHNLMTNATATTATDLSGNGYNGTFSSSPIPWIFDGKTASVSGFSSIAPTTTASFVVVFNLNSTPSPEETLFSLNGSGNGRISGSAGSSGFVWDFGNTSGETNSNARLYANPTWTVSGGWHTVVFTVTTGAMSIWLDGSEIASGSTSVAATPSGNMMIGDWIGSPGGSNQTLGMIASVLVYNRVLSSTEISSLGTYFGSEPRNTALTSLASNGLAQTPPMGWGSWESFNVGVTESEIEGNADYLVSTGLNAVGYTQIGIDGGKVMRVSGALQGNPVNFPDGIPAISTYIHNKGLKFWFYGAPGLVDCQSQSAEWANEYTDALTYASWGVDYYKYDWCSAQNALSGYAGWTDSNWAQFLYQWMAQQLRATGKQVVFSESSVNQGFLSGTSWESWAPSAGLNLFRNTPDIVDSWFSIMSNLEAQVGLDGYAGPGHWNDPDYLEVGIGGITDAQGQAQMSMWSVVAAPLNIGADLRSTSTNTIATLGNLDVINIDQDPMGVEGKRVSSTNCGGSPCEVWARPLSGGYCAIALLNQDSNEAHNLTANFATIAATVPGCGTGPFKKTLNVWANWPTCNTNHCGAPMGTLTDTYTATVPPTSVFLFTVGN